MVPRSVRAGWFPNSSITPNDDEIIPDSQRELQIEPFVPVDSPLDLNKPIPTSPSYSSEEL
jgi:hypothetical protein